MRLSALRNSEFYKKQAMRLCICDTPRIFDCSNEGKRFLGIPRGCMDSLSELLKTYEVSFSLEDQRNTGRSMQCGPIRYLVNSKSQVE